MTAWIQNLKAGSSQTREPLDKLSSVGLVPPQDHYSAMQAGLSFLQLLQAGHQCSQEPVSLEECQPSLLTQGSLEVKMLLISQLQLLPQAAFSAFSLVHQQAGFSVQLNHQALSLTPQLPYLEVRTPYSVDRRANQESMTKRMTKMKMAERKAVSLVMALLLTTQMAQATLFQD